MVTFRSAIFVALTTLSTVTAAAPLEIRKQSNVQGFVGFWNALFDADMNDQDSESCADYSLDETRLLDGRTGQYLISKVSENGYIAYVNVNYRPVERVSFEQARQFREKVKQCFEMSGALSNSFGEQIRLQLADENLVKESSVKPFTVNIHKEMARANSGNYGLNEDCQTILHETFHLLGLWDEYQEPYANMRCRTLGSSIMASQWAVEIPGLIAHQRTQLPEGQAYFPNHITFFKKNSLEKFRAVKAILCDEVARKTPSSFSYSYDKETRKFILKAAIGEDYPLVNVTYDSTDKLYVPDTAFYPVDPRGHAVKLPSNWTSDFLKLDSGKWNCRVTGFDANPAIRTGEEILADQYESRRSYPLNKGHFRKILFPQCQSKNQIYNLCTSEAYLVPSENYQCVADKNPICRSKKWLD